MYRCVADNWVRPLATYDATVYVFFRPRARAVQKSYGQAQNRLFDLTFECIVAGKAKGTVVCINYVETDVFKF